MKTRNNPIDLAIYHQIDAFVGNEDAIRALRLGDTIGCYRALKAANSSILQANAALSPPRAA